MFLALAERDGEAYGCRPFWRRVALAVAGGFAIAGCGGGVGSDVTSDQFAGVAPPPDDVPYDDGDTVTHTKFTNDTTGTNKTTRGTETKDDTTGANKTTRATDDTKDTHPGAVGPPADVWGLGATLYHAVSGEVPFPRPREARRSEDRTARYPQLVGEAKPLGADIPPLLADIIFATLAKDPARRPTAREVADALEPLVAEVPHRFTVTPRLKFVAHR